MITRSFILILVLLAVSLAAGCDTVAPVDESGLVVEGFLNSGRPLPEFHVRRTLSPAGPYDSVSAAVRDAVVEMVVGGTPVRYAADSLGRGIYRADDGGDVVPSAGTTFEFTASWNGSVVEAQGIIPPELDILDVTLNIPEKPVSAVLLDSLALSDSLATGAYTGYIYPIEATIEWNAASVEGWPIHDSWIRAQLEPFSAFSSQVVDLFLRSDDIFRESEQTLASGSRSWTGVYAVGVGEEDAPVPEHRLRVALVRSGPDYARFAASKDAPERREPISNVTGGIGIVAAVSVDSTHLNIERPGEMRSISGPP